MRKLIILLMGSFLSFSPLFSFWSDVEDSAFELGIAYRQDYLQWKTNDQSVSYEDFTLLAPLNSKMKWRNLNTWQIETRGSILTCHRFYLRGNADYGWIVNGKSNDKTFAEIRDQSFTLFDTKTRSKGNVYDARLAIGYQFKLCQDQFVLTPLVGYSCHGLHLRDQQRLHDNYYSYEDYSYEYSGPSSSSRPRGHGRYRAYWNGPFLGFDLDYRLPLEADWKIFGTYEFHWAHYHAKRSWTGRIGNKFDIDQHSNNAYGQIVDVGVRCGFFGCWELSVKGEFRWWWSHKGRNSLRNGDCSHGTFEHLRWDSAALSMLIGRSF